MFDHKYPAVTPHARPPMRLADPRRRMLDAFVEVVARRGYDGATVADVLQLAGVPEPVFYEHFEDKQDCLLATLDELIGRAERAISVRVRGVKSWPERVRLGLETVLEALAQDPDGARVAFVECLSASDPAIARLRRAAAGLTPVFEQGRSHNRSHRDDGAGGAGRDPQADMDAYLPAQTSEAIVGGIASIVHRRVLEDHTAELPTLLSDLLYFALMPYLGHERALAEAAASTPAEAATATKPTVAEADPAGETVATSRPDSAASISRRRRRAGTGSSAR